MESRCVSKFCEECENVRSDKKMAKLKDDTLTIRINSEDKKQIEEDAAKIGMKPSQYIIFQLLYKDKMDK